MGPELRSVCKSCSDLVRRYLDSDPHDPRKTGQDQVRLSIKIINDALNNHSINEIALSFNGGKDCLVMLVLFLAVLNDRQNAEEEIFSKIEQIPCVYVHVENSFQEVDDFVNDCKNQYYLDVIKLAPPLKVGFQKYLDLKPHIKAIFVGMRRTDPYGEHLTYYERTDGGWPDFMRVHPVLDWHYVEIWDFIRYLEIPYCPLYDLGYTSLGGTENTIKNPSLKSQDNDGHTKYKPAYELVDDDKERLSRMSN